MDRLSIEDLECLLRRVKSELHIKLHNANRGVVRYEHLRLLEGASDNDLKLITEAIKLAGEASDKLLKIGL